MALNYKPHTLTFYPVTESVNVSSVVEIPIEGAGVTIEGQLTPMTSQAAFERFGVELQQPHLWMCDDDDANISAVVVGSVATYGSRKFQQKTPVMVWDAIPSISCVECVLEEREYV